MAKEKINKSSGAKLKRTETVGVRLDPRLRYIAEIGARSQRRTLSSFIEWAIEESLKSITLFDGRSSAAMDVNLAEATADLWDVDEVLRFIRLADNFTELLTYEEQVLWRLIKTNAYVRVEAKEFCRECGHGGSGQRFDYDKLREHWETFVAVAHGKASKETLP